MSIEEAKATIERGIRSAEEAIAPFHTVAAQAGDLASMLADTARGSNHEKVLLSLSRLVEAKREAQRVEALLRSGIGAAHEYMNVLG